MRGLSGTAPADDEIELIAYAAQKNGLAWLDMSNNKIRRIPKLLCELINLQFVDLSGDMILCVEPAWIRWCYVRQRDWRNSRVLCCSVQPQDSFSEWFVQSCAARDMCELAERKQEIRSNESTNRWRLCKILSNSLSIVRNTLCAKRIDVHTVYVRGQRLISSGCGLTSIPSPIVKLKNLKHLYLRSNYDAHRWSTRSLWLGNKITSIPDSFAGLINLEALFLSGWFVSAQGYTHVLLLISAKSKSNLIHTYCNCWPSQVEWSLDWRFANGLLASHF